MIEYKMEHVFSYNATLAPPEVIGPVPDDIRINFYVTGGEVWGPKCKGKLKPVGGDWLILRKDGCAVLDVRATVETHDGAQLYVTYGGIIDLGKDGYTNFQKGILPDKAVIRAAPRIVTAHPDYAWVNRCQFVNIGELDTAKNLVTYDVYALR